jgi:uncharacterized protein YcgI (DUF1989 family)
MEIQEETMSNNRIIIEPKSGQAIEIKKGQILKVEDIDGGQVADFVCFSLNDHDERFSQAKTRIRNWSTHIGTGSHIISNRDNVMFTIVADTVSVHDIVFCPCHSYVYEHVYKVGPRNGCFENLSAAVKPYGISSDDLPAPFNIFMNTGIKDDGELYVAATPSKKGDYIELRADMDCLVAVSACADDISDCNNGECTRIGLTAS